MADVKKDIEVMDERISISILKFMLGCYHAGVNLFIHSNPGEGKSAQGKKCGQLLGVPTVIINASQVEPSDLMGVAYLQDTPVESKVGAPATKKEVKYALPGFAQVLNENPKGILLVDEITTATPALQTALLSLIQDGICGHTTIPLSTFRVACGNFQGIVGVRKFSPALGNRFVHIPYVPNNKFVGDGLVYGWNNYEVPKINSESVRVKKAMKYSLAVRKMLYENSTLTSKMPDQFDSVYDYAYPSPRSWEMLIKLLSVLDGNDNDYITALVIGTVGKEAGRMFMRKYMKDAMLESIIDIESYLGKEKELRLPHPDNEHPEEIQMMMNSAMYYLSRDPKKYLKLWAQMVNLCYNKNGDYGNYYSAEPLVMSIMPSALNILRNVKKGYEQAENLVDDWVHLSCNLYGQSEINKTDKSAE